MQQTSKSHQSLERALTLLLSFDPQNSELGTIKLSEMSGLHKSTVSRLAKVLTAYNFLQQNPATKKFSLGPAVIRLSQSLKQSLKANLVQIAKPYLDSLRTLLKETVILEILAGDHMVMVYVAEGPQIVRLAGDIGHRVPFHAAAGAKAFLAFCTPEIRKALLGTRMRRFTKNTITDPEKLHLHLDEIRRRGFAIDKEEQDEGTYAVGAPILNHDKKPIAAVVVAGPPQRIEVASYPAIVPALKETTAKISEQFYYIQISSEKEGVTE